MSLLKIKNLTVKFATATGAFTAVDGIDVSVDKHEVLAIVGESGSGKSVSMLAVMGLLPDTATITADEMTFDGKNLLNMRISMRSPPKRRTMSPSSASARISPACLPVHGFRSHRRVTIRCAIFSRRNAARS